MKIDKKLSASGAKAPDPHQGLCLWTLQGDLTPDLRYGLALHTLAMIRPSLWQILDTPLSLSVVVSWLLIGRVYS